MGLTTFHTTTRATTMTEPTAAAGTFAGYKLALFAMPIVASLIAFWLGLRFVPLRREDPHGDIINRVLACIVSAFLLGIAALVALMHHMPRAFDAGTALALVAGLPPIAGFFAITLCVFVVCSIPGPWLLAAVFLWLQRRKDKDIAELVQDAREEVSHLVAGKNATTATTTTEATP